MLARNPWARLAVAVLAAGGLIEVASANDASWGGAGGNVARLKEARVRMASEDLVRSSAVS